MWRSRNQANSKSQAAEYKRSDTNFYPKGDVVRAHPSAVIIAEAATPRKGDSYFFTPQKKAPREIYIEVLNDWIEPITPPDMPASLGVPPDAMQIREPQGDVQAALPSAPANFTPVKDGMTLPNGAVVKTGANGTAAVLFGGVDSARLMPNSEAAVQQTVTAQSRSVEVDLTAGGVFSKVGTQVGVKGEYEVHTPFGNAGAQGTDFVTIAMPSRTDVWIAQGTVSLVNLSERQSKRLATATSDGTGPLKISRLPAMTDPHQALQADAETMSLILNFIPMANQKIKALRDKKATGATLTANEEAYLGRIKQVPCLIKLALVEPPAPAPARLPRRPWLPRPPAHRPHPSSAPTAAPAPPAPANPHAPMSWCIRTARSSSRAPRWAWLNFKRSWKRWSRRTRQHQAFVIKGGKTVPYELKNFCKAVNSIAAPMPPPPPRLHRHPSTPMPPAPAIRVADHCAAARSERRSPSNPRPLLRPPSRIHRPPPLPPRPRRLPLPPPAPPPSVPWCAWTERSISRAPPMNFPDSSRSWKR